jgi:uncharacterized protein YbaR (Trm112 family)
VHLLLTDRLACPRCGAGFGLILRADKLVDRRVLEGGLGCPNCRDRFPIVEGFADLRPPPRAELPAAPARGAVDPAETDAIAAMLGVAEGPGNLGVVGALSAHAAGLADRIPGVEIVAIGVEARADPEREGVSRMAAGPELPFHPWSLRALALSEGSAALLERPAELKQLVPRGGRIVVEAPGGDAEGRLAAAGARVLARDARWLVGVRETS